MGNVKRPLCCVFSCFLLLDLLCSTDCVVCIKAVVLLGTTTEDCCHHAMWYKWPIEIGGGQRIGERTLRQLGKERFFLVSFRQG
ncbi:hypothetical protein F5B20DRAFT_565645 [Whalleya microplaca]|nr:hypothetical protein F5B20DRAFT_565645 [Whalleya microplaca]